MKTRYKKVLIIPVINILARMIVNEQKKLCNIDNKSNMLWPLKTKGHLYPVGFVHFINYLPIYI